MIFIVIMVFMSMNYYLSKMSYNKGFMSVFECGFEATIWEVQKMSLHFFKIGIIFILFDVELMFLIFLLKTSLDFKLLLIFHFFILLTLIIEILNKILKWSF